MLIRTHGAFVPGGWPFDREQRRFIQLCWLSLKEITHAWGRQIRALLFGSAIYLICVTLGKIENVVYMHGGILFSLKKGKPAIYNGVGGPGGR